MNKRILSIFLIIGMLMSMLPTLAFADDEVVVSDTTENGADIDDEDVDSEDISSTENDDVDGEDTFSEENSAGVDENVDEVLNDENEIVIDEKDAQKATFKLSEKEVLSETLIFDKDTQSVDKLEESGYAWDSDNKTLTIDGLNMNIKNDAKSELCGIKLGSFDEKDFTYTLIVKGDNNITLASEDESSMATGITTECNLNIVGEGENALLNISTDVTQYVTEILSLGTINIEKVKVNLNYLTGESVTGIAGDTININNSSIVHDEDSEDKYAITDLESNKFPYYSNRVIDGMNINISNDSDIYISTVGYSVADDKKGIERDDYSLINVGINAEDTMNIENSSVRIKSGSAEDVYGLYAKNSVNIDNTRLVITTENAIEGITDSHYCSNYAITTDGDVFDSSVSITNCDKVYLLTGSAEESGCVMGYGSVNVENVKGYIETSDNEVANASNYGIACKQVEDENGNEIINENLKVNIQNSNLKFKIGDSSYYGSAITSDKYIDITSSEISVDSGNIRYNNMICASLYNNNSITILGSKLDLNVVAEENEKAFFVAGISVWGALAIDDSEVNINSGSANWMTNGIFALDAEITNSQVDIETGDMAKDSGNNYGILAIYTLNTIKSELNIVTGKGKHSFAIYISNLINSDGNTGTSTFDNSSFDLRISEADMNAGIYCDGYLNIENKSDIYINSLYDENKKSQKADDSKGIFVDKNLKIDTSSVFADSQGIKSSKAIEVNGDLSINDSGAFMKALCDSKDNCYGIEAKNIDLVNSVVSSYGKSKAINCSGELNWQDIAVIKAGEKEKKAVEVAEYNDEKFVIFKVADTIVVDCSNGEDWQYIKIDEDMRLPKAPVWKDYTFEGWYTTKNFEEIKVDEDYLKTMTNGQGIYAKWLNSKGKMVITSPINLSADGNKGDKSFDDLAKYGIKWDKENYILTLDNATIDCASQNSRWNTNFALKLPNDKDCTIVLTNGSKNVISAGFGWENKYEEDNALASYGILMPYSDDSLDNANKKRMYIKGNGTLDVSACDIETSDIDIMQLTSVAIYGYVYITQKDNPTINASGGDLKLSHTKYDDKVFIAIISEAFDLLNMHNGTINATSGNVFGVNKNSWAESNAVTLQDMYGGKINATSGSSTANAYSYSTAVFVLGNITGGKITAKSDNVCAIAQDNDLFVNSRGVKCIGAITDGNIEAMAGTKTMGEKTSNGRAISCENIGSNAVITAGESKSSAKRVSKYNDELYALVYFDNSDSSDSSADVNAPSVVKPVVDNVKDNVKDSVNSTNFSDIKVSDWYYDGVKAMLEAKLISDDKGEFKASEEVSRVGLLDILAKMNKTEQCAIDWAKEKGISDCQNLDKELTREQMITMLYRFAQSNGKDVSNIEGMRCYEFSDWGNHSDFATNALRWALNNGLICGKSEDTLNPQDVVTNAEFVVILQRFMKINK